MWLFLGLDLPKPCCVLGRWGGAGLPWADPALCGAGNAGKWDTRAPVWTPELHRAQGNQGSLENSLSAALSSLPVLAVNPKKDSENTPVKGGTVADLGKSPHPRALKITSKYFWTSQFKKQPLVLLFCWIFSYFIHIQVLMCQLFTARLFPHRLLFFY